MAFYITATHHRGMKSDILFKLDNILSIKDDFITRIIDKVETYNEALIRLEEYAQNQLNAEYHCGKDAYMINEEFIFAPGDETFIYEGVKYEVIKVENLKHISYEWCNYCDEENEFVDYFAPQFCKICGKILMPCNLCEDCVKNCPLKELAVYMQETKTEIVFVGDNLRVNGTYLMCLDNIFNNIDDEDNYIKRFEGRKVFWLDPCFLDKRYHTSAWHTIESIDLDNEVITFVGGTESYLHECYL